MSLLAVRTQVKETCINLADDVVKAMDGKGFRALVIALDCCRVASNVMRSGEEGDQQPSSQDCAVINNPPPPRVVIFATVCPAPSRPDVHCARTHGASPNGLIRRATDSSIGA